MCNFNKLNETTALALHVAIESNSNSIGGTNYLLSLIESIKKKNGALMFNGHQIASEHTILKWNKVIFRDKVLLLEEILRIHRGKDIQEVDILDMDNPKLKKNILNMVKTLSPVEFTVTPQNHNDGEGFKFKVFDSTEDESVKLNPIFLAMFFCPLEFTKKALKYRAKD